MCTNAAVAARRIVVRAQSDPSFHTLVTGDVRVRCVKGDAS